MLSQLIKSYHFAILLNLVFMSHEHFWNSFYCKGMVICSFTYSTLEKRRPDEFSSLKLNLGAGYHFLSTAMRVLYSQRPSGKRNWNELSGLRPVQQMLLWRLKHQVQCGLTIGFPPYSDFLPLLYSENARYSLSQCGRLFSQQATRSPPILHISGDETLPLFSSRDGVDFSLSELRWLCGLLWPIECVSDTV